MDPGATIHQESPSVEPFEHLSFLLATLRTSTNAHDMALYVATGLPELLPCALSGLLFSQQPTFTRPGSCQWNGSLLPDTESLAIHQAFQELVDEAMRQGPCFMAHTPENSTALHNTFLALQLTFLALLPLRTLHQQFGVVLVGRTSLDDFSSQEVILLHTFAEQLTVLLTDLHQQQQQQQHVHTLQTLVETRTAELSCTQVKYQALQHIQTAITTNASYQTLLQALAHTLAPLLPLDRTTLTRYQAVQDVFEVSALAGRHRPQQFGDVGTTVARLHSHLGWVWERQQPLWRGDLAQEQQFPIEGCLFQEGIRSYVVMPLLMAGEVLGTLNIGSTTPHRYTEEHLRFLQEVGQHLALALHHLSTTEMLTDCAQLDSATQAAAHPAFRTLIGHSRAFQKVIQLADSVASTDTTVLLLGETGTGKDLLAKAIHERSERRAHPLIMMNCAALPAGLIESELFGHERGAFTGAMTRKMGRFEQADGGTIFLDEIGDLPLELQVKLLRVLQDGTCERLGGSWTLNVNVRVIAATNQDLERAVAEGRFRADLYYRLRVFPIHLPPLRERLQDIPLLVQHFLTKYGSRFGKHIKTVSSMSMNALLAYPWPGNVRELEHVIERAAILSSKSRLELGNWLPAPSTAPGGGPIPTLAELERDHILHVLALTGWRVSGERGAARVLGLKASTLEARMKKLGISRRSIKFPLFGNIQGIVQKNTLFAMTR